MWCPFVNRLAHTCRIFPILLLIVFDFLCWCVRFARVHCLHCIRKTLFKLENMPTAGCTMSDSLIIFLSKVLNFNIKLTFLLGGSLCRKISNQTIKTKQSTKGYFCKTKLGYFLGKMTYFFRQKLTMWWYDVHCIHESNLR